MTCTVGACRSWGLGTGIKKIMQTIPQVRSMYLDTYMYNYSDNFSFFLSLKKKMHGHLPLMEIFPVQSF